MSNRNSYQFSICKSHICKAHPITFFKLQVVIIIDYYSCAFIPVYKGALPLTG